MEASSLFSLFQIPYHIWIDIATMFAYKLNTPSPILQEMYMYDIILEYKKLGEILKQENGENTEGNSYEKKMDEYKNEMSSSMDSYKNKFNNTMPKLNGNFSNIGNINIPSLTSGIKMPTIKI